MNHLPRPAFKRSALDALVKLPFLACALASALALTGCGSGTASQTSTTTFAVTGRVHGGQQGVSNALVQLWAAGQSATRTTAAVPATQLIANGKYYLGGASGCTPSSTQTCYTGVYTDANGSFTFTNDYTCPSANAQVYVIVKGGNPGLSNPNANNGALLMMDPLGNCGNLTASTDLYIDEVTTVASAWALAQFMDANGNITSSPTNAVGLANAFLNARLLVDPATGMAPALSSNLTIETGKLYALANAIAPCVNSDGTSGCSPLFSAATPAGGTAPANTLAAALNIVRNPAQHIADVLYVAAPQPPYPSTLATPPNDWTMSLTVTGGGISFPSALDVDSFGNVWVANYYGILSAFSPQGLPLAPSGFYISGGDEVYGLTIDTSNNIWVTNQEQPYHGYTGSITGFHGAAGSGTAGGATGTYLNGNQFYYGGDTDFPNSMSADSNGNLLVANYANSSASIFNGSGAEIASSLGSNGNAAFPVAITADPNHGLWLANQGDDTVTHLDANGNLLARVICCNGANGIATDANGNAWIANYYGKSVSEVSNANAVLLAGDQQGGITYPSSLVVDAAQNVWIANFRGASFSELAGSSSTLTAGTAISPPTGYGLDATLVDPFSIAVDASGNLWLSSFNGNNLTMFFGLAAPTATPTMPVPTAP